MKIVNLGWQVLIVLSLTCYTANLAAFLSTQNVGEYWNSMEAAINGNAQMCAYGSLQAELEARQPVSDRSFIGSACLFHCRACAGKLSRCRVWTLQRGQFIYRDSIPAMLDSYESGECNAIVLGQPDIRMSKPIFEWFCDNNVVSSGVVVIEQPIALPARPEIVAGLSYWLRLGEKSGLVFSDFVRRYVRSLTLTHSLTHSHSLAPVSL